MGADDPAIYMPYMHMSDIPRDLFYEMSPWLQVKHNNGVVLSKIDWWKYMAVGGTHQCTRNKIRGLRNI